MADPYLGFDDWVEDQDNPHVTVNAAAGALSAGGNAIVDVTFASDADDTLSASEWTGGAVIRIAGSITATRVMTAPATARKVEIWNDTSQSVTIRSASPSDPVVDVTIAAGARVGIVSDGADIRSGASGDSSTTPQASAADIRSGAADVFLTPERIEAAAELVTLTDAATIAVDWSAFITGELTLGGNRTLGNPTNGKPGTTRTIFVVQDGTGSRTLAFAANYKFQSGTPPTLTTDANGLDVIQIICRTTTEFIVTSALDFS